MIWTPPAKKLVMPRSMRSRQGGFLLNPSRFSPAVSGPVTWNPATKGANITLDNSDMRATRAAFTSQANAFSTTAWADGSARYAEFVMSQISSNQYPDCGICVDSITGTSPSTGTGRWTYSCQGGRYYANSTSQTATYATLTTNDVFQLVVSGGKLWLGKNNTWFNSGDPAAGTNPVTASGVTGSLVLFCGSASSDQWRVTLRCKLADFSYTPPSGISAWEP